MSLTEEGCQVLVVINRPLNLSRANWYIQSKPVKSIFVQEKCCSGFQTFFGTALVLGLLRHGP